MIVLYFLFIPIFLVFTKICLYLIVLKYGKFSYDGFSAAGFKYHSEKDIFYSVKDAWQKNFGYTHLYDVFAPFFQMIIDTEPVRFYYDNKNWLITFWKGQYGITTGCEIGIYSTKDKIVNKKTVYLPVDDDMMLDMDITLYKNNELITKVKTKHWWLAVFKLGMFSKPKELIMDISIKFPNESMLDAFLKSFKKLKHSTKNYRVENDIFYFKFIKPKTRKVWTRIWFVDFIRQHINRKNVNLYNKYISDLVDDTKDENNEKLINVNDLLPDIIKNPKEKKYGNKKYITKYENKPLLNNQIFLEYADDKNE